MRLFKFLHLIGLAGLAGGLAAQLLLARIDPPSATAAEAVGRWLTGPALLLLVAGGLLGIAARPAWLEDRWMLAKVLLMLMIAPAVWFGAGSTTLVLALVLALAAAALGVWRPGGRAN